MLALNEIIGPLKILKSSNFSLEIQGCMGEKRNTLADSNSSGRDCGEKSSDLSGTGISIHLCLVLAPWYAVSHLTKADTVSSPEMHMNFSLYIWYFYSD